MKRDCAVKGNLEEHNISVSRALCCFQGIKNAKIRWIMVYLPYMLLVGVVLVFIFTKYLHIMYISMLVAVAFSLLIFWELMASIPKALSDLWYHQALAEKTLDEFVGVHPLNINSNKIASHDEINSSGINDLPKDELKLKKMYINFIKKMENTLNDPFKQFIFSFSFALVLLSRSVYEFWRWLPNDFSSGLIYKAGGLDALVEGVKLHSIVYVVEYSVAEPMKFWMGIFFEPFLGFILGLVAWRMFVIAKYIDKLGQSFDLIPKLEHDDESGGLGSLGRLSLLNALIISIWGTFLGGWIVIGSITKYEGFYTPLYKLLLIVPIIMSIICFILPLRNIHVIMANKKEELRKEYCNIDNNIDLFARRKLDFALLLKNEGSEADEVLGKMKESYKMCKNIPVWPFNYKIFLAFISSQIVPLLGLAGFAKPIVDVAESVMGFINQLVGGSLP